jgi:hypothetical protein
MRSRSEPTPQQIANAPELAILCALDGLLEIARRALIAAHPTLGDTDAPYWACKVSRLRTAAGTLIERAAALQRAIHAYTDATTPERSGSSEDDIDIPF